MASSNLKFDGEGFATKRQVTPSVAIAVPETVRPQTIAPVQYVATQAIASALDTTHFDFGGYTLRAGERMLAPYPGVLLGVYRWDGARWVAVPVAWFEGAQVSVLRGAVSLWQQTSATGGNLAFSRVDTTMSVPAGRAWVQSRDGLGPIGVIDRVNVMIYGAKGDGVTDDTAAIQACLDAHVPSSPTGTGTLVPSIYFPAGVYALSAPLTLYGAQVLEGDGPASKLLAKTGFSGSKILSLDAGSLLAIRANRIQRLGFASDPGVSVSGVYVGANIGMLEGVFDHLWFATDFGMNCPGYLQGCRISHLYATTAAIRQILYFRGNINDVSNIYVEMGGSGTEAFIQVDQHLLESELNRLHDILLEGTSSPSKTSIYLNGTNNTELNNIWNEGSDDVPLYILNRSTNVRGYNLRGSLGVNSTITLTNGSSLWLDYWSANATSQDLAQAFLVDASSSIDVGHFIDRTGLGLRPHGNNQRRTHHVERGTPITGYASHTYYSGLSVENLLVNGSFEVGAAQWTYGGNGSTDTITYPSSTATSGNMLQVVVSAAPSGSSTFYFQQSLTVDSAHVGLPYTISALVKADNTTGAVAQVIAAGCGIGSVGAVDCAPVDGGWHRVAFTVCPVTAGTLIISCQAYGVLVGGSVCFDDVTAQIGFDGIAVPARFGSINVAGCEQFYAAAAPTDTHAKQGAIAWNSAAASGQPLGWVFDGSAWKALANIP